MSIDLRAARRIFGLLAVVLAIFTLTIDHSSVASAQEEGEPAYAILIVGDEGDAEMLRREKVLINEMAKRIRQETNAERLPIYSYHFNKERERAYCENKLNVLTEDLLFVGIVSLEKTVPLDTIYRIDRIQNPSRAAKDVLARAELILAGEEGAKTEPQVQPSPSASPSPSTTSTPTANPSPGKDVGNPSSSSGEGFRIQLGSFTQLKYAQDRKAEAVKAGMEVVVTESKGTDGDMIYKVVSPTYKARPEADKILEKFKASGFDQAFLVKVGPITP